MEAPSTMTTIFGQCRQLLSQIQEQTSQDLIYEDLERLLVAKEFLTQKITLLLSDQNSSQQVFENLEKEISLQQERMSNIDELLRKTIMCELDNMVSNAQRLKNPKTISQITAGDQNDPLGRTLNTYSALTLFTKQGSQSLSSLICSFPYYALAKQKAHFSNSRMTVEKFEKVEQGSEHLPREELENVGLSYGEQLKVVDEKQFKESPEVVHAIAAKDDKAWELKKENTPNGLEKAWATGEAILVLRRLERLVQRIRTKEIGKEELAKEVSTLKARLEALEGVLPSSFQTPSFSSSLLLECAHAFSSLSELALLLASLLDIDITSFQASQSFLNFQHSAHLQKANQVIQIQTLDAKKQAEFKQIIFEKIFSSEEIQELFVLEGQAFSALEEIFREIARASKQMNMVFTLASVEVNARMERDEPMEEMERGVLKFLKTQFPAPFESLEQLSRTYLLKMMASLTSKLFYHSIDLSGHREHHLEELALKHYLPAPREGEEEENFNSLIKANVQEFRLEANQEGWKVLKSQKKALADIERCRDVQQQMVLFTQNLKKFKLPQISGQEASAKVHEGLERPQGLVQSIFEPNQLKQEVEHIEQFCKNFSSNLESLQTEIGFLSSLTVEFRILENLAPFFKENLTELIFLGKLNNSLIGEKEVEEQLEKWSKIEELWKRLEENKFNLEELDSHLEILSPLCKESTFLPEQKHAILSTYGASIGQLNSALCLIRSKVQASINYLLESTKDSQNLESLILGERQNNFLKPSQALRQLQSQLISLLSGVVRVKQDHSQLANISTDFSRMQLGKVNGSDYFSFLWEREQQKTQQGVLEALQPSNFSNDQVQHLKDVLELLELRFSSSYAKIYPIHLLSKNPAWPNKSSFVFQYFQGEDEEGNSANIVSLVDTGNDYYIKNRNANLVMENLVSKDKQFLGYGMAGSYFSLRKVELEGEERLAVILESKDGKVLKKSDEMIVPSQLQWIEAVDEEWRFNWRTFERFSDEDEVWSFQALVVE